MGRLLIQWQGAFTGGVFTAALTFYERIIVNRPGSFRAAILVFIFGGLLGSSYQVWSSEHQALREANCKLNTVQAAQTGRAAIVHQRLEDFYVRARSLFSEPLADNAAEDAWREREAAFANEMFQWLASNLGRAAAARAVEFVGPSLAYPSVNKDHENRLNWLSSASRNLDQMMQQPQRTIAPLNLKEACKT